MGLKLKGSNDDGRKKRPEQSLKGAAIEVTSGGLKLVGGGGAGASAASKAEAARKRAELNEKKNQLFKELTEAMISCLECMNDADDPEQGLAECKKQMEGCIDEYVREYEGDLMNPNFGIMSPRLRQRVKVVRHNVNKAETYKLLERYVYNLTLGAEGMSTNLSQRR